MNQKSNIIFIVVIVILAGTTSFLFSLYPSFFRTNNYSNLPGIASRGNGTYTMKNSDAVMLNNGISISLHGIDKLEKGVSLSGSPVGVYKYPSNTYEYLGGPEVGVTLVVNESRFMFLSPTNSEQQIIERGNNDFTHPGVVMKLISVDKDNGEAIISFRSITGGINLDNPFLVIPIAIIIQAILVFIAEFIIKRRSANVLYRYTLYRSILYTIPILLLTSFLDSEWGIFGAIIIFPVILIESIIASFMAYKIVINRKRSI